MKLNKLIKIAVPAAFLAFACSASATYISGSIGFTGTYQTMPTAFDLGTADALHISGVSVTPNSQFGDYAAVPNGYSPINYSNVTFDPITVGPLWSFNYLGVNYTFTMDTMTLVVQNNFVVALQGNGTATIDGFQPTNGRWTLTANQNSQTLTFSSGADVPDGGTSIALLGASLLGLAGLRRKFRA
jgi:hypothetical protein